MPTHVPDAERIRATTILALRHGGRVVMAGDGQVSFGPTVMKRTARKVRAIHDGKVLAGFAGASADAFTLFEKFEAQLQQQNGNLRRAAVELAKDWRTDRVLRRLEAMLLAADRDTLLLLSGGGRCHRARRRRRRDRLGRQLRSRRCHGADAPQLARCRRDRPRSDGRRRFALCIHE